MSGNNITNLSTARVKKLEYVLLSGYEVSENLTARHDSAYRLWKNNWLKTFTDLKSEATPKAEDFTRQTIIGALFQGDEAVGMLLYTHFNLNLEAMREHSYLSSYPAEIISRLRAEGHSEVLSMEYLTLDSRWRKSVVGVPIAEVILGLGAKVARESGLSAAIAVTRVDRRVNEILYSYGAQCLVSNLTKHNVSVDLVSFKDGHIHPGPNAEVNELVEFFWQNRNDTIGLGKAVGISQEIFLKRAA